MFETIKGILSSGPETMWVASVTDPGYIVSTSLTPKRYEKKEECSHDLEIEFAEPVRDGNDVSHLNLRNDGQITWRRELFGGEESLEIDFNPGETTFQFVTVTTEGDVCDTAEIEICEEIVAE